MSKHLKKSVRPKQPLSPQKKPGALLAVRSQRPRVSLCMIVKNEERFLRNCLASVAGVADEIVIVDTGSTDGTLDIARAFGAKIIEHAWNDDFSTARNVSLAHATGDWALWLDADEEIDPECRLAVRAAVDNAPARIGAYLLRIHNWMQSFERQEGSECIVHHAARLFRRLPGVCFQGRIHEQNLPSLAALGFEYVSAPHLILDHFGYIGEVRDEKQKNERTIRLLTREIAECPVPEMHSFQCFNLGLAYSVLGENDKAAEYMALAAANPDPQQEHTNLLFALYAMVQQQRDLPEEGLKVCAQADALGVRQPGLEFARGYCLRSLARFEESVSAFRAALALGQQDRQLENMVGDVGLGSFKARYGLALSLTDLQRYDEAIAECQRALEESDGLTAARYLLASLLAQIGRIAEAADALRRVLHYQPDHADSLRALGILLIEQEQAADALPYLEQAAQYRPEDAETLAHFARCCEQLGRNEEAREIYLRLRELVPDSPEICVNLGRMLTEAGRLGEAIGCFADAIELDPEYANAYFNVGDVLYRMGHYEQAAQTYLSGLKVEPEHESGYFVLGNCYYQTGNVTAAVQSYQQALVRSPDDARVRHNLALAESHFVQAA